MRCSRLTVVTLLACAVLVASAPPAAAHGVGGIQPSNYETRVLGISPPVVGVTIRAVDLGNRLELRNMSQHDVTVLGYESEPYLRVGPRGVFENQRSPAVYLNRDRYGS